MEMGKLGVKAVLAVEGLRLTAKAIEKYDEKLINEHHSLMVDKVLPAIRKALNDEKNPIPNHLKDELNISLIANVVLYGGDDLDIYTQEVIDTGLRIFWEYTEEGQQLKKAINNMGKQSMKPQEKEIDNTKVKKKQRKL